MIDNEWRETLVMTRGLFGSEYLYRQLAEECSELAIACLKCIRAARHETPATEEDARAQLIEEMADVYNMLDGIRDAGMTDHERHMMETIGAVKRKRMRRRLKGGQ